MMKGWNRTDELRPVPGDWVVGYSSGGDVAFVRILAKDPELWVTTGNTECSMFTWPYWMPLPQKRKRRCSSPK